jgi:hypothetical protein
VKGSVSYEVREQEETIGMKRAANTRTVPANRRLAFFMTMRRTIELAAEAKKAPYSSHRVIMIYSNNLIGNSKGKITDVAKRARIAVDFRLFGPIPSTRSLLRQQHNTTNAATKYKSAILERVEGRSPMKVVADKVGVEMMGDLSTPSTANPTFNIWSCQNTLREIQYVITIVQNIKN